MRSDFMTISGHDYDEFLSDSCIRHFLRGSSSQGVGHAIAGGYGCGNGGEGSCGGGIGGNSAV